MDEKTVIIFIGIQASGKSSFYREKFSGEYIHVNMDTLRKRKREEELVEALISEGKSFVVDNTNPTREDRLRYIPKAKEVGYKVVGYYFQSVLKDCVRRNKERGTEIPSKGIAHTSNIMELPEYGEGFDELWYVSMDEKNGTFIVSDWSDGK